MWDHVVFAYGVPETADPWVLLTVIAMATERIRLGPLVTPVARRRPGTLARQATSLDRLSGGRLIFGAGLGFTLPAEYGTWGESVEPRVLARRLDEGLEVLARLWSGERVDFRGEHVTADGVTFAPVPTQRPRPPVWIGCDWPSRPPLRRAARWDGIAPMIVSPRDGSWAATPEIVAEIVAAVGEHRDGGSPFDVVITGRTQAAGAEESVTALAAAARPGGWRASGPRLGSTGPPSGASRPGRRPELDGDAGGPSRITHHQWKERSWNHRARTRDQARKRRISPRSCGTSSRSSS